jgi:hypothetical protein
MVVGFTKRDSNDRDVLYRWILNGKLSKETNAFITYRSIIDIKTNNFVFLTYIIRLVNLFRTTNRLQKKKKKMLNFKSIMMHC